MNVLIGDIGNTITKICVIESNTLKILKTIYFNTNKIFSKNFLKITLKKFFKKEFLRYKISLLRRILKEINGSS